MLSKEDNEVLTQVGPGTPMGELFRRFWLPAMLSIELPEPDCEPVRLRLLGEELITFRDSSGRVGCVDAYCPHRGAALFFGRNEEDGLRCIYHGWKFNVDGDCVHMPNCVEGESYRLKLKITAYPAIEGGGMIWFYMGPRAKMPPEPGFEFFHLPASHTSSAKYVYHSNYMQAIEGDMPESHVDFLHATLNNNRDNPANKFSADGGAGRAGRPIGIDPDFVPAPGADPIDYEAGVGFRNSRMQAQQRGANQGMPGWFMPCFDPVGIASLGTRPMNIKVPADDQHTIYFRTRWSPTAPLTEKQLQDLRIGGLVNPPVQPGTFLYQANIFNDYNMDRVKQRYFNFSGMSQTAVQDTAMQENQWGPIADRTREHLVSTDKTIIHVRHRLITTAKALAQGVEPTEPHKPEAYRLLTPHEPIGEVMVAAVHANQLPA